MTTRYKWWEVFLTDHQAHSTAELARITGADLEVLCVEQENEVRKGQGWTNAQLPLRIRLLPRRWIGFVRDVLRDKRCVHIFAGPFGDYRIATAFLLAAAAGRRVYLLTEPYSPIAYGYFSDDRIRVAAFAKSRLRPLLYRFYGLVFSRRIEGAFAISPLAAAQLRDIGIPRARIHPFGYFVPVAPGGAEEARARPPGKWRIIYVGTLNQTKGVDLLVAAAELLARRGIPAQIDVYGHGDAARFGLDTSTVKYRGPIAFGHAQHVMRDYDLLVLPSRYDGWGVVVNEAVLADLPIVCSSNVGAAAMVRKWGCGVVYERDTKDVSTDAAGAALISALADALVDALDAQQLEHMRVACRQLRPYLSPAVAGRYMQEVIEHGGAALAPPENPWY